MLDIRIIREHPEEVKQKLALRGESTEIVDRILKLDENRRQLQHEIDELRAAQNRNNQALAKSKSTGQDTSELHGESKRIKVRILDLKGASKEAKHNLNQILLTIPNLAHESVPEGDNESANRIERTVGEPPKFNFESKDHVELGEELDILDFERAAKLAGARFCVTRGAGARLERALINFMLDVHTREHGYTEVVPPFLVNAETMQGTGQLPKFEQDLFKTADEFGYYLIPTAEVPLTNLHAGEILNESDLPLYFTAYTPCFRSEAGSYGKDTRGMLRQHQFNKVELVKLTRPEDSYDELEKLTRDAEVILQRLEIPYRVVTLSTGDMGFAAAKTYDIEVWLPGQDTYREISSCSNCTDFQARRASIRFRRDGKKPEFVHTLNGSGIAVGRTVIAILENFQNEDGSVTIPPALRPYMNGIEQLSVRD